MQYCSSCVLPNTRPNLVIGKQGICTACLNNHQKKEINWQERNQAFLKLVEELKTRKADWDCVIPVSGGKDSTWQTIKALEHGLKPLCVTWKTPARNSLGQKNLDNLIKLGVDHFDISINPEVEKYLTLKTFEKYGSVAIPMHMALFAIPLQIALKFRIPLILWGENSAIEYGGSDQNTLGFEMNRDWLMKYGVTHGTVAEDWLDEYLSPKDLSIYHWPTDEMLKRQGIHAAFLGWYFPWDPNETYRVAQEKGFEASSLPKTGYYKFADIDDEFLITLHHAMKWYKFGFTRLWDNLSIEIRSNRLTRSQAIDIIKERGTEIPKVEIEKFCAWSGISTSTFDLIVEKFRNHNIWYQDNAQWKIRNFLISDWSWE